MELSQECQSWPSLCLRSWPYASAQDRQTELFTAAAFPDQAEKLLENTSMFKNMPLNIIVSGAHVRSEESCCHRRVRQQHSAPYEFYRKHLNALLRLIHCSFGEQFNILNITQREREGGIVRHAIFWKDESWSSVQLHLPIFFFFFHHAVFCSILCTSPLDIHT